MREQRSEIIGDRRVCLVVQIGDYYAVTIEVASRRYRQRLAKQQARVKH
jgi:hypothetical protein